MKVYTIGLVGGMGMAAGIELERRIIQELERKAVAEHEYPRILSIHDAKIPDRSAFLLKRGPNPAPHIAEVMDTLGALGADVLAMPCNSAHAPAILDQIEPGYRGKLVSIVDAVIGQVSKSVKKGGRVGVLATQGAYVSGVYRDALTAAGHDYAEPDNRTKQKIMGVIYQIKDEGVSESNDNLLRDEFKSFAKNCDAVILGCTELGLSSIANEAKAIDSLTALAKKLVERY